jgi:short-subunit dehydrogenase
MQKSKKLGTVVITGASTGIGAVYADRFAYRRHNLILIARDYQRLEKLAYRLYRQYGVTAEVMRADLSDKNDLRKVEKRLREDTDISVLVNNAGINVYGGLIYADADKLEMMIDINIVAVMRLTTAVISNFVAGKSGTVINIGSVSALAPELFNGSYSGTKAYILNFTQALQSEVGQYGVRVQAVLPGATRTEIWERAEGNLEELPQEMIMSVYELVDAALAGLDGGELITIPSLPNAEDWEKYNQMRLQLIPNLSRSHAAARYKLFPVISFF